MNRYIFILMVFWFGTTFAQSDSLNIRQISRTMYGTTFSSWASGNYAYIATGASIIVLNISDISNPAYVSHFWMPDISDRIWLKGNYLYTASELAGLRVIDISDPLNPQEAGSYSPSASFIDIFIEDSLAYLANNWNDFRIVNITNPGNPQLIGQLDLTADPPRNLYVSDSFAYMVGEEGHSLRIVNISDPTNPFEVGWYDIGDCGEGVFIRDTLAFIACGSSGLKIFNIADPGNINEFGSYNTSGYAWDVIVDSNYAYVADDTGGLRIIDVSDISYPVEIAFYDTPGNAFSIFQFENYICVSDQGGGWWVIDVDEPLNPVKVSDYFTGKATYHLAIQDNLLYVALSRNWSPEGGMRIFNIFNPASPESVGYCDLNDAYDIDISGDYAYTCGWDDSLRVIDVSIPSSPSEIGKCNLYDPANCIKVMGNYAYIAVFGAMKIVFITNPDNPQLLSNYYPVSGNAYSLYVSDNLAYIGADSGLFVVDVSDPYFPLEVGNISTNAPVRDVDVDGNYAYMVNSKWIPGDPTIGLEVIDITNPTAPESVSFYNTLNPPTGISVSYPYAYVSCSWDGLLVFDVSDPTNPQELGYYDTGDVAWDVTLSNGLAYVPCQTAGFYILEYYETGIEEDQSHSGIGQYLLYPIYPNPFTATTSIDFEISDDSQITLEVYDISGRLVRTLVRECLPVGRHSIEWDGKSSNGEYLSSGLYFVKFKVGDNFSQTRKLLLLR